MHASKKKEAAKEALRELDIDLDTLQQEWAVQVTHQTKPLPKCGGNKVAEEVEKILALEKLVENYGGCVAQLESDLTSNGKVNIVDYNVQLAEAQSSLNKATGLLHHQETALGVVGHTNLNKLHNNVYLQAHINALALKTCI
ncbi:hypothetical protein PAXRUDRAFT_19441 [Paxillus rubicundulus Ve08.2h10]|uniref:Uncharacterized protein n=1 Tax=Paxillus rubicundulus Ve08.2h10 TaxID=930991 RepID=A0A0D0D4I3_9AGAM|nr:hypothetical protein PAXRUDRAFT_19441 [Paxillus rubicundulus Ve08.2h10]